MLTYVQERAALTYFYAKYVVHVDGVSTGPVDVLKKAMHSGHGRTVETSLCIVARPTGCGKSTFVTRILRHAAAMIDPTPERITWCYGEWQEAYATMDLVDVRFEEGLLSASMFVSSTRNLIVIDDLMAETDERVTILFTKKSHHRNSSVLYLVQNLFPKNKESRTISLNSQYMVMFKNPREASQMSHMARQVYPGRVKFVQEAFKDATSVPYG